jgi:peptide chain release factor 1
MLNPYQSQIDDLVRQIAQAQAIVDDPHPSDPEFVELAQAELAQLRQQKAEFESMAETFADSQQGTASTDIPTVRTNCTIEIRPGTGGDEAKIWASDLERMYLRFAEIVGIKTELIDDLVIKCKGRIARSDSDASGSSLSRTAYQIFQFESGVHRVQRVPSTEAQGRIHTSTASIAVLPEVAAQEVSIRDEDLVWSFMRSSGAGGQSVNKTNSAVRLVHTPSGIVVNARQERKQTQNRSIALELLRAQLWEIEEEKRLTELGSARSAIGRARRSEKIRTYNFPQNRVTDHRTKQSWHNLSTILEGDILSMLSELGVEMEKVAAGEEGAR